MSLQSVLDRLFSVLSLRRFFSPRPRNIDKAIAILQKTQDGNQLSPGHLSLVEAAANGHLTPAGEKTFAEVHKAVAEDRYVRPWLHGVAHLTKDHLGYVLWRNKGVEHFSFSDPQAEKAAAIDLAERCLSVESRGFPVNGRTISSFSPFVDAPADTPWLQTMLRYYTVFERDGKCRWLVLNLDEGAVAMSVLDRRDTDELVLPASSQGEIMTRYALSDEFHGGAYTMFHALQAEGLKSNGDRLHTYAGFIGCMNEAGITPEAVHRVFAAGVPKYQAAA